MNLRVAIVAADFNKGVVEPMIEAATDEIAKQGGTLVQTVRVPGAYELPLPVKLLLEGGHVDAVIALGFIERGETLHGEIMGHAVHAMLLKLQLKNEKPIGIGIIGPGATPEQAETRKIGYARAAVSAAFAQRAVIDQVSHVAY